MIKSAACVQQKLGLIARSRKYNMEPDITKMENHRNGITTNLTTLFAFLDWCWMISFKIEYSAEKSTYCVISSTYKKVIIWCLQFVFTSFHVLALFQLLEYGQYSVETLMKCVMLLALLCWSNIALILLWKNRHRFVKIMIRLDVISKQLISRGSNFKKTKTGTLPLTLMCIGCVLLSLFEVIFITFKLHQNGKVWKPTSLVIAKGEGFKNTFPGMKSIVLGEFTLFIIGLIHVVGNKLFYFSISHFAYTVLFTMCSITGELYRALNASIPKQFCSLMEMEEVVNMYTTIRGFMTYVNVTIGTLMAWGVIAHLPYNAYKIGDMMHGDLPTQISYVIHVTMYLAILFAGANVHTQINNFMDKISCDKLALDDASMQARISLLFHQSRWAGIRGGGFFLLTYGFLGNIVGVILTYAILMVQFQQNVVGGSTEQIIPRPTNYTE